MHRIILASLLAVLPLTAQADAFKDVFPGIYGQMPDDYRAQVDSMDLQFGTVAIPDANAKLNLGQDYYYLPSADARRVLEDFWGNPPDSGVLGMVFPREYSPFHQGNWGIVLSYAAMGYVSDEDAATYDYDEILADLQSETAAQSLRDKERGYGGYELLGWAAEPHYDLNTRTLYWAKEVHFEGSEHNTLNYDVRVLGRRGVLVMGFVSGMDSLAAIDAAIPDILDMAEYDEGHRYTDFDPSIDTVAAVGVGGLIAGKVAAKTGLLVGLLLVLKKAWFLLLLPFIWLKNLFTGRRGND